MSTERRAAEARAAALGNCQAFPGEWTNTGDGNATAPTGEVIPPRFSVEMPGVTIRQYFAGLAMQAIVASPLLDQDDMPPARVADYAVGYADALILALAGWR